jgi:hypothetical protein
MRQSSEATMCKIPGFIRGKWLELASKISTEMWTLRPSSSFNGTTRPGDSSFSLMRICPLWPKLTLDLCKTREVKSESESPHTSANHVQLTTSWSNRWERKTTGYARNQTSRSWSSTTPGDLHKGLRGLTPDQSGICTRTAVAAICDLRLAILGAAAAAAAADRLAWI